MDWDFKDLENMKWSKSKSSNIKGPKRMCKFCILAIVVPIVLLCIPLYMRYQALKPHRFTLSPSDMKLLNQVRKLLFVLKLCQNKKSQKFVGIFFLNSNQLPAAKKKV